MKFRINWYYVGPIIGKLALIAAGCMVMWLSFGEAPPASFRALGLAVKWIEPYTVKAVTFLTGIVIVLFGLCLRFEDW